VAVALPKAMHLLSTERWRVELPQLNLRDVMIERHGANIQEACEYATKRSAHRQRGSQLHNGRIRYRYLFLYH
jgi:hypothetical protein